MFAYAEDRERIPESELALRSAAGEAYFVRDYLDALQRAAAGRVIRFSIKQYVYLLESLRFIAFELGRAVAMSEGDGIEKLYTLRGRAEELRTRYGRIDGDEYAITGARISLDTFLKDMEQFAGMF